MSVGNIARWSLVVLLTTGLAGILASDDLGGVIASPYSKPVSAWCGIVDFGLAGHVYNSTITATRRLCWDACKAQRECISSNFASGTGECEFSNVTLYDAPDDLSQRRGWVHTYSQIQSLVCGSESQSGHINANLGWPLGTYGLPMPTAGCPTAAGFTWETGYRFHDTEDSGPHNEWTSGLHLKGPYAQDDMTQHFCMKTVDRVNDQDHGWPLGEYCVFKYGTTCPNDTLYGSFMWDDQDENNNNDADGTGPSGAYTHDTRIDYCCMTAGNASRPIALPTGSPFYLFAFTAQCQEVQYMRVSREWFKWDNEDDRSSSINFVTSDVHPYYEQATGRNNHKIYYCYYEDM